MECTILSLWHLTLLIVELYYRLTSILYIVTVWRLSTPELSTLQSQGLLLAYSLLPWPDSRNNSKSISKCSRSSSSLQYSSALISSTLISYQVAWETSSHCRPSNRTLLAQTANLSQCLTTIQH